jgi:hypothetical protein
MAHTVRHFVAKRFRMYRKTKKEKLLDVIGKGSLWETYRFTAMLIMYNRNMAEL